MRQYHTIIRKKIMLIVLLLIFIISLFAISFADSQNVKVSIFAKPKIDIALAKSMTETDVTNFKDNLYEQLKAQNIDTSDVEISTVQAEQVDLTKSFLWQKDISSSIGSISITNNGQSVVMKGNYSLQGKNAIWIIPDKENEDQCFKFNYNIDFGDSFNAAGMLLKVKQENKVLTGYMLSFNNSNWNSASGGYNGAIWEFSYKIGDNSNNITKTLKKGLNINKSGTLTVNTTDTEITVEGGGLSSKQTYVLQKEFGNGYGFFSDHYSHGCDSYGSFTLKNIQLEATSTKSFEEILRQPEWRDGSYRFLVDVTDKENPELSKSSKYGELITRLINDNIYFIGVGKDKNESQLKGLLQENDNKGIFIKNTDFNQSLTQIAQYIKSLLDDIKESNYLIVGEPVRLEVDPEDAKSNTIDEKWPSGKWKANHDYEYYENDLGQSVNSGKYVPDIITSFDKTGKFNLTYQDKAIDPEDIYVHRKPVASFIMTLDSGNVNLESNSYDLDEFSNNNGISEEEWKWKTYGQTEWTDGKLTTYDEDKIYLIQLRVKDFQNTWSDKTTKFINIKDNPLPVAMFNLKENLITKYESLRVEDQSYDPTGKTISSYNWEIYKDSTLVYSGNEVEQDFTSYELGNYTIRLVVTNSENVNSEQYIKKFTIVNDTTPPEVVANPIESDWETSVTVNLSFSDRGGSQFKSYKYAITDSQETPTSWSNDIYEINSSVTIEEYGNNKYLHIIAEDNEGNVSEDRVLGAYKIDRSAPNINIKADLTTVTTSAIDMIVSAVDAGSGLKYININGEEYINGSTYKITTNGIYTIEAGDNLGNTITKRINVTNINRVCDKGLGHIDYSSSLDECPICESIKNVKVLDDSFIYNGQEQGVSYKNPDNVEIISYYNGKNNVPRNVGIYKYELKVIYNGLEYNTDFNGQMEIEQKEINITNIKAENRKYNGTTKVQLSGGELQGIEQLDNGKVDFIIPELGTIDSKNIGNYNVEIEEIKLTGEESGNYKLIQPEKTEVQVEITPKKINIENIKASNRQYNGTDKVQLSEGELQGIEQLDNGKVDFIIPELGTIDSKNIGTYNVEIEKITLTGEESENYKLIQPEKTDVQVEITSKEINITNIKASNRQYNGTDKVQLSEGELQGIEQVDNGKVEFVMPKEGAIDSKNVGKYNVTIEEIKLTGEESENYKLIQPEKTDVQVEITPKEINITNIKASNRQYNGTDKVKLSEGELQGIEQVDNGKVEFVMPKEGTIDSKNIGNYNVTIEGIKLTGEESENYKLIQPKKTDVQVEITPKEINIINIKAIDKKYDENDKIKIEGGELVGIVDGDDVTFILSDEGIAESYHIGQWNVKIGEIKLEGKEKDNYSLIQPKTKDIKVNILDPDKPVIYSETTVDSINEIKLQNEPNAKVRVKENDLIKLSINVKNKGLGDGYAKEIGVKLPENMEFIEDNEVNISYNWKKSDDGMIKTDILKFENGNKNRVISSIEQPESEKEVKIEIYLKVNKISKEYQDLIIKTNIIQTDINNTIIENLGDNEEEKLALRSNYSSFNAEERVDSVNDDKIKISKDEQIKVENNDIVVFSLKVYNKGEIDTYVSKIMDTPEDGLEFIPDNEINKKYKWSSIYKEDAPVYISNYLEDTLIKTSTEDEENAEEIKIAFKVRETNEKGKKLKNSFKIEETKDIYNSVVENINDDTSDEKDIYIKYFDLSLKMKTTSIKVYENNKVVKENIQDESKDVIAKIELERKKAKSLNVKVFYNIYITNEGEIAGYAKEIKDYLPVQMKFEESENENWTQFDGGTLICKTLENEEIKPGETKVITLCLNWINDSSNFGAIKNEAEISRDGNKSQTKDIDSMPDNKNDKEDDFDNETVLISISTGAEKAVGVILYCIIISLCIYVYIKKR